MLIQCDAKALEWRVCLELCQDEIGIAEVLNNEDVHALNQKTFNLPTRLISKKYLFRTIFNHGNGYAFTVDPEFMHVSTSVKYWDEVGEKFYGKYKGLEQLYQRNMQMIAEGKPLEGPLGRFWPLEMEIDWKGNLKIPETRAVNYPVQGTGADVMTIARISFMNRIKKLNLLDKGFRLVSSVHDSIVGDAPRFLIPEISRIFHEVFNDIPVNIKKIFGYEWRIPFSCEVKVGANLKDMKEIT